jgi:hypothetical protein
MTLFQKDVMGTKKCVLKSSTGSERHEKETLER